MSGNVRDRRRRRKQGARVGGAVKICRRSKAKQILGTARGCCAATSNPSAPAKKRCQIRHLFSLSKKSSKSWAFLRKYGIIETVMKVIVKGRENRDQLEIFSIEGFVPADHLLRKIDSAVDFNHIYDIVEDLYCADNGRPSIDPVVIFKMVLIQHLYGLPSLRRTVEEIKMNVAYRWFLGYLMNEQIPHFSTVSYNFKHRYTEKTIEEIFYWILNEIETAGYLSPEAVFVDGTHIKANANLKKAVKKAVPQAAKIYEKQLMEEINEERNDHGKKPFDETKPPEEKEISESTTDPESGVFHKGEHKKCFAYTAQTCCDKNGYVMDVTVNPGNVHDSVAFDGLYDRLVERNPEIKAIVADAGYKTPWISKRILDDGRIPVLPYKRPMSKKGFFPPYEYVYDEYFNCVICPENQVLSYATTNREGYREFKSKGYICENCPSRHLCTENQKFEKTITKHIWSDYLETVEDIRHTPEYKALYERRKETIERVFADAKEKYAMRYTPYRGLSQVTNWVRLKFATMNLKKYALHRWKRSHQYSALINLYTFFAKTKLITLNLAWNLGLFDRLKRSAAPLLGERRFVFQSTRNFGRMGLFFRKTAGRIKAFSSLPPSKPAFCDRALVVQEKTADSAVFSEVPGGADFGGGSGIFGLICGVIGRTVGNGNGQIFQLSIVYPGRCVGHQFAGIGNLREGNHIPQAVAVAHQHTQPIQPEGHSAVRRCAVTEGINEEPEFFVRFFFAHSQGMEHMHLQLGVGDPD